MRRARFSIISSVRRHTVAGLIVKDLFRGFEFWLVDEGLESSLPDEAVLATRLYTLEGFAMTAGVLVPLDIELIEYAIADTPQLLRKGQEEAINDRRFAETIYRAAVAGGSMERVAYQDTFRSAPRTLCPSASRLLMRQSACARRSLAGMIGDGNLGGSLPCPT